MQQFSLHKRLKIERTKTQLLVTQLPATGKRNTKKRLLNSWNFLLFKKKNPFRKKFL